MHIYNSGIEKVAECAPHDRTLTIPSLVDFYNHGDSNHLSLESIVHSVMTETFPSKIVKCKFAERKIF